MVSEDELFAFLVRKYTQRSDARQTSMGLQYMSAETHDLASELVRFIASKSNGDAALAIGEHAFRAGFMACYAAIGKPGTVQSDLERAWSDYDPPEDIKALT